MKRRSFNKKAIIASAWVAPTVSMVSLPSHAQATETPTPVATQTPVPENLFCIASGQQRYVAVAAGAQIPVPRVMGTTGAVGDEGSFDLSNVCITDGTTRVEMVATNNNAAVENNQMGLLFDESLNLTVVRPDGSRAVEGYASFGFRRVCNGVSPIQVPSSTNTRPSTIDISHLFQDASGSFIPGSSVRIIGEMCNAVNEWRVLSFDIVVTY